MVGWLDVLNFKTLFVYEEEDNWYIYFHNQVRKKKKVGGDWSALYRKCLEANDHNSLVYKLENIRSRA